MQMPVVTERNRKENISGRSAFSDVSQLAHCLIEVEGIENKSKALQFLLYLSITTHGQNCQQRESYVSDIESD